MRKNLEITRRSRGKLLQNEQKDVVKQDMGRREMIKQMFSVYK